MVPAAVLGAELDDVVVRHHLAVGGDDHPGALVLVAVGLDVDRDDGRDDLVDQFGMVTLPLSDGGPGGRVALVDGHVADPVPSEWSARAVTPAPTAPPMSAATTATGSQAAAARRARRGGPATGHRAAPTCRRRQPGDGTAGVPGRPARRRTAGRPTRRCGGGGYEAGRRGWAAGRSASPAGVSSGAGAPAGVVGGAGRRRALGRPGTAALGPLAGRPAAVPSRRAAGTAAVRRGWRHRRCRAARRPRPEQRVTALAARCPRSCGSS